METLKFFLLFLTAVESASCHRPMNPSNELKSNAILELLGQTSSREFNELYGELEAAYKNIQLRIIFSVSTTIEFSKVADNLNNMMEMFMNEGVKNYMHRHLMDFCDLTVRLIDGNYPGVREELGFPDDCVYCVFRPIHESGTSVGELFEAVYLLRSLDLDDLQCPIDELRTILSRYRKIFEEELTGSPSSSKLPAADTAADVQRLRQVKREIASFSRTFCPFWTPVVSHDFLRTPVAVEVRNESRFVRHVHFNEKCRITEGDIKLEESMKYPWWEEYPKWVNYWIFSWNCGNILDSPEYGFKKYEKSVNPKELETVGSTRRPKPETVVTHKEFSLAELKERLKSYPYYQNALRYDNIVSDVVFMASLKEAGKMIRGMTLVARWSCSAVGNDETVDTIRGLRSTWYAFKSVLNELFDILSRNKTAGELEDIGFEMERFDKRVGWFMRFLDLPGDTSKHEYCDKIPETLKDTSDDAYPGNDPIGVLKFRGYHFDEPMFHVTQLYRFKAHGF